MSDPRDKNANEPAPDFDFGQTSGLGPRSWVDTSFDPSMVPGLEEAFMDFLDNVQIQSKENVGLQKIQLYNSQKRALRGLFDGLSEDKHWFVILKARQLGITTIMYLLDLFWISVFPGLQGAIVTDTEPNKNNIRVLLQLALDSLPPQYAISVAQHNKDGLVLSNGSQLMYLVAGVRKNVDLGRSRGLNFLHATEVSSWKSDEGFSSLEKSLSKNFPARLYVFESTAKGFNLFHRLWRSAQEDEITKVPIFIGWWANELYDVDLKNKQGLEIFSKFGPKTIKLNKEENALLAAVKSDFGFEVSATQLAWYRHQQVTNGEAELKEDENILEFENGVFVQEMPWTDEQAFVQTSAGYFNQSLLSQNMKWALEQKFQGFRYYLGEDFLATQIEQVRSLRLSMLRVWQEPDPTGVYVVAGDPAYGSNELSDTSCAQVLRCYADKVVQVAEFASNSVRPSQFAWVLAHLGGCYGPNVTLIIELNGPGETVMVEFDHLKLLMNRGYLSEKANELGLKNILTNVKTYLYRRLDNVEGGGFSLHWRSTQKDKYNMLMQFRDSWMQGNVLVKSTDCIEEMKTIVQEGDEIRGEGHSHDDRVIAIALANRCYTDRLRTGLVNAGRTFERETTRKGIESADVQKVYMEGVIASFFREKEKSRAMQRAIETGQALRGGRRRRF